MHVTDHSALNNYFDLMTANATARVYQTAQQTGLISALATGPKSISAVAKSTGFHERPIELIFESLVALELLEQDDDQFTLAPVLNFLKGNYQDLGNDYWDHLPTFLQTGIPCRKMDDRAESEAQYAGQAAALRWMMSPAAQVAAEKLHNSVPLAGSQQYLDVAGGSAVWSMAAARLNPFATVTVSDWPSVLTVAKQTADLVGLSDRVETLPGDFFDQDLPPDTYDLSFVANFAHLLTEIEMSQLLVRVLNATRIGGRIAIIDVFAGQPRGDISRTMYQLGLELRTENGCTHSVDELANQLISVGYRNIQYEPIEVTPYTMGMLTAMK